MEVVEMSLVSVVGNNDAKVSEALKCRIQQDYTTVIGVVAEGTSRELSANWISPFEGDNIGSKKQKLGGFLSALVSLTLKTEGMLNESKIAASYGY